MDLQIVSRGGKFNAYIWVMSLDILVPKYVIAEVVHLKGKLSRRVATWAAGIETPMASDLVKLILKLETLPKLSNSAMRFGKDRCG